ncbi:hypothetical protein [Pantoea eucrina]|nr:hypothetical protein [Pantoea eucrina]ORM80135.1 hypothetical protein HA43_00115 [Pantoea eucrina]
MRTLQTDVPQLMRTLQTDVPQLMRTLQTDVPQLMRTLQADVPQLMRTRRAYVGSPLMATTAARNPHIPLQIKKAALAAFLLLLCYYGHL